jgi:hypothetical protein
MIRNQQIYRTEQFEKVVLSEIEKLVNSLPAGVATCYIGPSKHDPNMIAPTFEIQPANPDAARIAGVVMDGEGVAISVGHSRRELWYKRTDVSEASDCARLVSEICCAVFAGNFTERMRVDRRGRRISSHLKLLLNRGEFRMWQNRLLRDLLRRSSEREIHYPPYADGCSSDPMKQ